MKHDYLYPCDDVSIVSLDLELTGLNRQRDRIIQYGLAGNKVGQISWLVNPETDTGRDMSRISGVTSEQVNNATPLVNHLYLLRKHLTDAVVVMHKSDHDWGFLCKEFERLGEQPPVPDRIVCTLYLSKHILKLPGRHTLTALCQGLNIPLVHAHNAGSDSLATYRLFLTLVNRYWSVYFNEFFDEEFQVCSKYFCREPWLRRARLKEIKL